MKITIYNVETFKSVELFLNYILVFRFRFIQFYVESVPLRGRCFARTCFLCMDESFKKKMVVTHWTALRHRLRSDIKCAPGGLCCYHCSHLHNSSYPRKPNISPKRQEQYFLCLHYSQLPSTPSFSPHLKFTSSLSTKFVFYVSFSGQSASQLLPLDMGVKCG